MADGMSHGSEERVLTREPSSRSAREGPAAWRRAADPGQAVVRAASRLHRLPRSTASRGRARARRDPGCPLRGRERSCRASAFSPSTRIPDTSLRPSVPSCSGMPFARAALPRGADHARPHLFHGMGGRPRGGAHHPAEGRLCSPELPWAIWYPLRRSGAFEELPEKEQRAVLAEHGGVGQSFGKAGVAHDIRLACHGLSKDDNDFVIGILGAELYPAVRGRAAHAQDPADLPLPRAPGSLLRRPRALAGGTPHEQPQPESSAARARCGARGNAGREWNAHAPPRS